MDAELRQTVGRILTPADQLISDGVTADTFGDRWNTADLPLSAAPSQRRRRRERHYRRSLGVADAGVAGGAVVALALVEASPDLLAAVPLSMLFMVLVSKVAGLYDRDELVLSKTTLDEAPAVVQLSGLFVLAVWLASDSAIWPAAAVMALMWAATCAGTLCARAAARVLVRRWSAPERCLLVGAPASLVRLRERIVAAPGVKAEIVLAEVPRDEDVLTLATDPRDLASLIRRYDIHRVVIAPRESDSADTVRLVRSAKAAGVRVTVLPRLFEVVGSSVEFDQVDGLTMLGVRPFGLSRSSHLLKRAFDVAGSAVGLVAVAPIIAAIALWVRLDSDGPVFFRQVRVGRGGERFYMLKFRSMVVGADARKDELRHLNETSGLFKIAADPRVTRAGRFLRATSLD